MRQAQTFRDTERGDFGGPFAHVAQPLDGHQTGGRDHPE
jgi:hypothetical protein